MEPQLPTPSSTPEQAPLYRAEQPSFGPEVTPQVPSPEQGETFERKQPSQGSAPAPAPTVSAPPLPAMPPKVTDGPAPAIGHDSAPLIAADDDLIEKEWVEKAKKVIAETRHDPHLQEQAVSQLQADYLQKRYNKTVKVPSDG